MGISKDRLKFAICSRWFYPEHQGGIAMHSGYLVAALKDEFEMTIYTSASEINSQFYDQLKIPMRSISAHSHYTRLHQLAKTSGLRNGLRYWTDLKYALKLAIALEKDHKDVIEFMDIHSEAYAYLQRNPKRNNKVVIRAHTPWGILRSTYLEEEIRGLDGWWAVQREKFCFQKCDAITTPSEDLKSHLIQYYNLPEEKITVIPNILDTAHFRPLPKPVKVSDKFIILHVGRFERAKGVITLIKSFIELAQKYPQAHLINIGPPRGNAFEICKKLVSEFNLEYRVTFGGFISYEKLPEYYATSDLVIVPSEIYESFSYTVAQAMACGVPVIASNIGGMPETLGPKNKEYIFEAGNSAQITKLFEKFILNPVLLKESGKYVLEQSEKFGIPALSPIYKQYYQNLLS
jgi:glycosyltransferase involved in cell wall biosynthesis